MSDEPEKTILIVNDLPEQLGYMSALLGEGGYRVLTANDGDEGIEVAKRENPDLVISDVMMPRVNGIELCKRLRAEAAFRATPILLVSSELKDTPSAIAGIEAGADDYVEVPFDPLRLIAKATQLIERKQAEKDLRRAHDELALKVEERTAELSRANQVLKKQVAERESAEEALHQERIFLRTLIDNIPDSIYVKDLACRKLIANIADLRNVGVQSEADVLGKDDFALFPKELAEEFFSDDQVVLQTGRPVLNKEESLTDQQGQKHWLLTTKIPLRNEKGQVIGLVGIGRDITERKILESQLRQAQKMEAIGQLAAGIAHEINTPTQYVGDNTLFLRDAFQDLTSAVEKYELMREAVRAGSLGPQLIEEVESAIEQADIPYLAAEIPRAFQQSLEGIERITKIVQSMKVFAHPGTSEKQLVDLNKAIESTITVARNEWKYVAEMETDFDPQLPGVPCLLGEFNQVILNLIVNAAHAIADVVGDGSTGKGVIRIGTRREGDWVEVRVGDTGTGIPEEIRPRIFDPFFTTKEIGKGTGQGLTLSHGVIVEKHGGTMSFETREGAGTTFIIRLPLLASDVT